MVFGKSKKKEKKNKQQKGKKVEEEPPPPLPDDLASPGNPEDLFDMSDDPAMFGNDMDETEKILLVLHSNLTEFYNKHKPANLDEDILTILMQFYIDAGGVALNKKLMQKYGEDLTTFNQRNDEAPPPPPTESVEYAEVAKTMNRISKRQSLEADIGIQIPPPPKVEIKMGNQSPKASMESKGPASPLSRNNSGKKKQLHDPELDKYKEDKDKQVRASRSLAVFPVPSNTSSQSDSLRLDLLDHPKTEPLEPRDYIEAFYSKFDESKLDSDTGIEKFVQWVNQHSLQALSEKLKGKYKEGLYEQETLARRRKNLETLLTQFYVTHDIGKLETRWTIMKILSWTMTHGIMALNKKFMTRYGHAVVEIPSIDDLDI